MSSFRHHGPPPSSTETTFDLLIFTAVSGFGHIHLVNGNKFPPMLFQGDVWFSTHKLNYGTRFCRDVSGSRHHGPPTESPEIRFDPLIFAVVSSFRHIYLVNGKRFPPMHLQCGVWFETHPTKRCRMARNFAAMCLVLDTMGAHPLISWRCVVLDTLTLITRNTFLRTCFHSDV